MLILVNFFVHLINTIGSVDDLIEHNNKIIQKIKIISDLIFNKYLLNNTNNKFLTLGEYCSIKTGKLNTEEADNNGKYPFFTCAKNEQKIDKYAFDCKAIIIAGNGEISCKYYEGKFNAYQRTYVLSPTKYFYLFQKACEFNVENLKLKSQGSVIKFITKPMLQEIKIPITDSIGCFDKKIETLYELMFKIEKQNSKLRNIKSNLLSKYF